MDARRLWLGLVIAGVVSSHVAAQGWTNGSTPAATAPSYDRYGQPITAPPAAASITQRTQEGFSSSGTAIKEGFDAGVRAAGQSLDNTFNGGSSRGAVSSPWTSAATTSAATTPSSPWTSNTAAASAAPRAATLTPVEGGWTSIGTTMPAPPVLIPTTQMNMPVASNPSLAVATTRPSVGASFPAMAAATETAPIHSVLADPAKSPTATTTTVASPPAADSWSNNWSDNAAGSGATISRGSTAPATTAGRDTAFPPLSTPTAATSWSDPWAQTPPATAPSISAPGGSGTSGRTGFGTPPATTASTTGFAGQQPTGAAGTTGTQFAGQPAMPSSAPNMNGQTSGQTMAGFNTQGTIPNNNLLIGANQTTVNKPATQEPQPWMPLIAAVLTLAGSLAANLYLGVSYLDARQKYQSLVRKTADTFRRVKAVAA